MRGFLEGWVAMAGWRVWHVGGGRREFDADGGATEGKEEDSEGGVLGDRHYVIWVGEKV